VVRLSSVLGSLRDPKFVLALGVDNHPTALADKMIATWLAERERADDAHATGARVANPGQQP
jgi:hypothetical protein